MSEKIRFLGSISTMGPDKMVAYIPKESHNKARKFRNKKIFITLEEVDVNK